MSTSLFKKLRYVDIGRNRMWWRPYTEAGPCGPWRLGTDVRLFDLLADDATFQPSLSARNAEPGG